MKTAFRLVLIVPIGIVLGMLGASGVEYFFDDGSRTTIYPVLGAGGFVFFPALVMIVFRQKYPRWWFDWNFELLKFQNRVSAYLLLLRDEYPSTDEEQAIHLELPYPDAQRDLNRWLPLVKWILAIPHYFILFFLGIGIFFAVVIAWFAILFTGRYPEGLFGFVVDAMRWGNRVAAYAQLLVTDKYPPFVLGQ